MPRKKRPPLSFVEQMKKLRAANLTAPLEHKDYAPEVDECDIGSLSERVRRAIGIIGNSKRPVGYMLFFVMYDIESNKVRTLVYKYLKRMGCTPIQRSIFLADAPLETYIE